MPSSSRHLHLLHQASSSSAFNCHRNQSHTVPSPSSSHLQHNHTIFKPQPLLTQLSPSSNTTQPTPSLSSHKPLLLASNTFTSASSSTYPLPSTAITIASSPHAPPSTHCSSTSVFHYLQPAVPSTRLIIPQHTPTSQLQLCLPFLSQQLFTAPQATAIASYPVSTNTAPSTFLFFSPTFNLHLPLSFTPRLCQRPTFVYTANTPQHHTQQPLSPFFLCSPLHLLSAPSPSLHLNFLHCPLLQLHPSHAHSKQRNKDSQHTLNLYQIYFYFLSLAHTTHHRKLI